MSIWPTIERFIAEHGAAALVTLARGAGLEPARGRRAHGGARRTARFTGTIGGGALEWGALAEAQALLARRDGPATRGSTRRSGPISANAAAGACC